MTMGTIDAGQSLSSSSGGGGFVALGSGRPLGRGDADVGALTGVQSTTPLRPSLARLTSQRSAPSDARPAPQAAATSDTARTAYAERVAHTVRLRMP